MTVRFIQKKNQREYTPKEKTIAMLKNVFGLEPPVGTILRYMGEDWIDNVTRPGWYEIKTQADILHTF